MLKQKYNTIFAQSVRWKNNFVDLIEIDILDIPKIVIFYRRATMF